MAWNFLILHTLQINKKNELKTFSTPVKNMTNKIYAFSCVSSDKALQKQL